MTPERLKELDTLEFWSKFEAGLVRPTPKEACEFVATLRFRLSEAERKTKQAENDLALARSAFGQFSCEVQKLARKWET